MNREDLKVRNAEWQRMRSQGRTVKEIAEQAGVTPETVKQQTVRRVDDLAKTGTGRRRMTRAHDVEAAEMWAERVRGKTYREIAEQFGLKSADNVSVRIRQYGLSLPEQTRDVIHRQETELLQLLRGRLFAIIDDPDHIVLTSDKIAAIRALLTSMERLAKLLGLDASDEREERRVRIEEQKAELIAQVLRGVILELGHNPDALEVREITRRHLAAVSEET